MLCYSLSFFFGIFLFFQQATLPTNATMVVFISLVAALACKQKSVVNVFALGMVCAYVSVMPILHWTLPDALENKALVVEGIIASMPMRENDRAQFIFLLNKITHPLQIFHPAIKIRTSVLDVSHVMHVGQKWRMTLKLKRIHTVKNSAGFDGETAAFAAGIRIQAKNATRVDPPQLLREYQFGYFTLERLRERLRDGLLAILPKEPRARWLLALAVGDHSSIPESFWTILRATGTNHLMAIAGLHLGLMTSAVYFAIRWLMRFFPRLLLMISDQHVARVIACIMTLVYASLSGFSVPTQRALLMLSVHMGLWFRYRTHSLWDIWACAFSSVLFMHPTVVLQESFYLSFVAIALIFFGMGKRLQAHSLWWKYGRVQWVLTLGLIPLSVLFYYELSLISVVANCIAIPFLMIVILPLLALALFSLIFSSVVAQYVLQWSETALQLLFYFLKFCAELPFAACAVGFYHAGIFLCTVLATLIALLPRAFPGRYAALVLILPLFFYAYPRPPFGEFILHVLDVGQGLSIMIQTERHSLLYDAGPAWKNHYDAGASVVFPFLIKHGLHHVDTLVISHGDADHSGGAEFLYKHARIDQVLSGEPERLAIPNAATCYAGQHFTWDGVRFEILHPDADWLQKKNNSSCVLKISNDHRAVLLTGDIEKKVQVMLSHKYAENLHSAILIAPHHGSKTSIEKNFLSYVKPDWVLFSTGYLNRYGMPHPQVKEFYQRMGTRWLNTPETGSLTLVVNNQKIWIPFWHAYRLQQRRFWMD